MNSSPTPLHLPNAFPYPIKITALHALKDSQLTRGTRLLEYSFLYVSPSLPDALPETRFGTWESPIDGRVDSINLRVGAIISQQAARDRPALVVIEPCKHDMQHGGMCVVCGKDMTTLDYIGFSDAARANIQMTHSAFGPTVSIEYARQLEREAADHLLKSRKLTLIVDLDQTIVHATVDPTVGEWINEGEAWEARHPTTNSTNASSKQQEEHANENPSEDPGTNLNPKPPDEDDEDECNPNWEALKDVKRFRLGPESFGPPALRDRASANAIAKGKNKMVEMEGCMYYIKPRPGWKQFLRETATKYEMHVYTMGTRAYAEEVCAAIDPDGSIFGGRLLSRDESGSLTQKSLQRLFPTDTSMVVIIDDRADVWEWSPNLLKVIPYDFFIGIGDINSSFLPKVEPLTPSSVPGSGPSSTENINGGGGFPSTSSSSPNPTTQSTSSPGVVSTDKGLMPESKIPTTTDETVLFSQNNAALDAQLEERPLAKKEREMQEHEHELEVAQSTSSSTPSSRSTPSPPTPTSSPSETVGTGDGSHTPDDTSATTETIIQPPKHEKHHKKALLKNDDYELERIGKLLNEVHHRFFDAYDEHVEHQSRHGSHSHHKDKNKDKDKDKSRPRSKSKAGLAKPYDVTKIIPRIRSEVFEGVHILFSSVIPLDTRPESTEIWRMAHMFGARCSTELTPGITHVVAAKRGTVKVDMARRRGGIKIVWLAWFTDSIALWQRQDEKHYLLDEPVVPLPLPITPLSATATTHPAGSSSPSTGPSTNTDMDDHEHDDHDGQHLTSSDFEVDLDSDDWDQESILSPSGGVPKDTVGVAAGGPSAGPAGAGGPTMFPAINWDDINDEVEAAMNESDDDEDEGYYAGYGMGEYDTDGDGDGSSSVGMRSGNVSEVEDGVESTNSTPKLKRKRPRSRTPSDYGGGGGMNGRGSDDDENLGSPLAKRKKLAADRTGTSRLKQGITAEEMDGGDVSGNGNGVNGSATAYGGGGEDDGGEEEGEEEEDDEEEEEEEEDDFLARELEEEWG